MLSTQDWFAFIGNGSHFNFTRAGEVVFPNSGIPTAQDNYGFCQVILSCCLFWVFTSDRSSIDLINDGPFKGNCSTQMLLRGQNLKRAKGQCPSERKSKSWYITREWNSKRLVIQHEVFWLFLYLLCLPQEVVYNTTFYAPPVVLVSVHHQYNRQNKKNVPPENNIVTGWVEVRYVFSVYSSCNKQWSRKVDWQCRVWSEDFILLGGICLTYLKEFFKF